MTAPKLPEGCDANTEQCVPLGDETKQSDSYIERRDAAADHVSHPVYGAVLLGIGGAVIAGGLIWHFLEPTVPRTSARIRLTPFGVSGAF